MGFYEDYLKQKEEKTKKKVTFYEDYKAQKTVNQAFLEDYIKDSQQLVDKGVQGLSETEYGNVSQKKTENTYAMEDLAKRGQMVQRYIDLNKDKMSQSDYDAISQVLNSTQESRQQIKDYYKQNEEFFNQFGTESNYNDWKKTKEDKARFKAMTKEELELYLATTTDDDKTIKLAKAEWYKRLNSNADFQEKSGYEDPYDKWYELGYDYLMMLYDENNYKEYQDRIRRALINNMHTDWWERQEKYKYEGLFGQDITLQQFAEFHPITSTYRISYDDGYKENGYEYMTADEVKIYNYLYETKGADAASEYLDIISNELIQRKSQGIAEITEANGQELLLALQSGLNQAISGYGGWFKDAEEAKEYSSIELAASQVIKDLENDEWGQLPDWAGKTIKASMFNMVQTTANMLPSILVGAVTESPELGSITLGVSAGGNARVEALRKGWSENEANWYGVLVGASEATLQYVLGGISTLGGKSRGFTEAIVNKFDNALARVALSIGGIAIKEGVEEGLQEYIEPLIVSIVKGVDYEAPDFEEALYAALMGAMMGILFEGGSTIAKQAAISEYGSQYKGDINSQKAFVNSNLNIGAISESKGQKYLNRLNEGKSLSNTSLGLMAQSSQEKIVKNTIRDSLVQRGATGDVTSLVDAIYKKSKGDSLSLKEKKLIDSNPLASRVIEAMETNDWQEKVNTNYANEIINKTYDQNNNAVEIKSIDNVDNGKVTVTTDSGVKVEASTLQLGHNDAILIDTVKMLKLNPEMATAFYNGYANSNMSAEAYARGFREAYMFGELGLPQAELSKEGLAATMSADQRDLAYKFGENQRRHNVEKKQADIDEAKENVRKAHKFKSKGKVHYEEGMDFDSLSDRQRTSLKVIEKISKVFGIDVYIYESLVDENGKRLGANGFFDAKDNSIHLDLFAGQNGEQTMLYTMSHELTHFIKVWSPSKYEIFSNILMEYYTKEQGLTVTELVGEQIKKAKENGRIIDAEEALEEVVADSCEAMLTNEATLREISNQIKTKDQSLWNKIKSFFATILARIKAVYNGLNPSSREGQIVQKWLEQGDTLQKAWAEALVDATETSSVIESKGDVDKSKLYSLRDSDESLSKLREKSSKAWKQEERAKKKLDSIGEYPRMSELQDAIVSKDIDKSSLDEIIADYDKWRTESGYTEAYERHQELYKKAKDIDNEISRMEERLSKALRERKYSEEEIKAIVQKAVRRYHTTSYLSRASYLLTTGSMLDFSDGQGYRVKDHREIAEILDLPEYASYSDGMIVFMNMGNIRLQTYGIDISVMPNSKQISALRDIISRVMREYDEFTVDFSKPNGNSDGSVTYPKGVSTSKIIADIKNYFETGTVPEYEDNFSQFRYSIREKALSERVAGDELLNAQDLIEDVKKVGGIVDDKGFITLYHRTNSENAKKIQRTGWMSAKEDGIFFSTSQKGYAEDYGKTVIEFSIPAEMLVLDDLFDNEAHLRLPLNKTRTIRVREYLKDTLKYSTRDSLGNELSKEQQEFFKDSKVRDDKGNLLVVYHNTNKDFTVFDKNFIGTGISSGSINNLGDGFYFTDAEVSYIENKKLSVYLDIKNPYYLGAKDNMEQWRSLIENSNIPYDKSISMRMPHSTFSALTQFFGVYGENLNNLFTKLLKEQGYDGIIEVGGYSNDYVVFESNQIKLTTNKNPTNSDDIRYSVRDIVGASGKNYGKGVYLDSTLLSNLTDDERIEMVKEYLKEIGGSVFTAYDNKGNAVYVHIVKSGTKFKNSKGKKVFVNQHLTNYLLDPVKQEAIALIDELILTARQGENESAVHPHGWLDNNGKNDWDVWRTYIQDKEKTVWEAKLRIANSVNGEKILYEVYPIKKVEGIEKIDTTSTKPIISQKDEPVKRSLRDVSLDFDDVDAWFESLSAEEFQELIGESLEFTPSEIKLSKQERRDAYVSRLYKEGKLDELITKLVKSKPQMARYFANTQMNQKYNPLSPTKDDKYIVMFHGTPKQFNVFDTSKIGTHGTAIGSGIYFTENLSYAESYKEDGGKVIATLLNIEKPLSRSKLTISKSQLKTFIREVVDPTGEDFLSNYGDVEYEGYEAVLNKAVNSQFEYNKNDADLIESIYVESRMDFDEFHNGLTELLGFDGIIAWNKAEGTQAIVFKSNQAKDIFNFNPTKDSDIRYQDRSSKSVSNRSLLANALESVAQNEIENKRLSEYKQVIAELDADTIALSKIRAEIKELSFGKGQRDTQRLKELKNEAIKLENRISIRDKKLLKLESTTALSQLLEREKEKAYSRGRAKAREIGREAVAKAYESRDKRDEKTKLFKTVTETINWLTRPKKEDVKCPDYLKKPLADFLDSIDYSSKRLASGGEPTLLDSRMSQKLNSLANVLQKVTDEQNPENRDTNNDSLIKYEGYLDLPTDFVQALREMAEAIDIITENSSYTINDMSAEQIKALNKYIKMLVHSIKNMATLYNNIVFANATELGTSTVEYLDSLGVKEKTNKVFDYINWDNGLPYYVLQRFGKAGESIMTELMDAQDKLAFLSQEIFDFKDKTWTDKEADKWSNEVISVELNNGEQIELTVAQAMGIYCLSNRVTPEGHKQGLEHMIQGGVKITGDTKGLTEKTDITYLLTYQDVVNIVGKLDSRQIEVAKAMQNFMSTVCAKWGNEVSMKRFLVELFTETLYYPIESDSSNLKVQDPKAKQSDLFRLLNISATKPLTPNANNRIIIRNIFEVFARHSADMARLNAFGMPVLDYMKWLNYKTSDVNAEGQLETTSVVESMNNAYGKAAFGYVLNLIKDINGRFNDSPDHPFIKTIIKLGKTAAVGANLRVMALQFTAYPRANMVLSTKSLLLGLTKVPKISMAKKYCGIALWKSFGYYDTDISRTIEEQLKGAKNLRSKLIELSMKGAEWADAITWGALWNACEYEVAQTTKNKIGSEEFYKEVGLKLREVVYATQVVDSVLTRSQLMRSKSGLNQLVTAFQSESTLTNNILYDAANKFAIEKRRTDSAKDAWKIVGKYVTKVIINFVMTQALVAALESLFDAMRDDDEEEFWEKYKEAFGENFITNINPLNNVPIVADVSALIYYIFGKGYGASNNSLTGQWLSNIQTAYDSWVEIITNENSSVTTYKAIYDTLRALSSGTGLPIGNFVRDAVSIWNNTAGAADPSLKVHSYEPSNEELGNALYNAIIDGDSSKQESYESMFEDESEMKSALKKALRTNDPRIREAALASYEGNIDTYEEIFDEILAEGNFDAELIKEAISSELNAIKKDNETDTEQEEVEDEEPKQVSKWTNNHLFTAYENGNNTQAKEIMKDLIAVQVANGKTEKEAKASIKSAMTSRYKPAYIDAYKRGDSATRTKILRIMTNSGLYGSYDEVHKTATSWLQK